MTVRSFAASAGWCAPALLAASLCMGCGGSRREFSESGASDAGPAGYGADASPGVGGQADGLRASGGAGGGTATDASRDAGTATDASRDAGTATDASRDAGAATDASRDAGTATDASREEGTGGGALSEAGRDSGGSPSTGSGGGVSAAGGSSGSAGSATSPDAGACAANDTEPCGECGKRTCDPATLSWGACVGDGSQLACWETEAGAALPGEMPEEPEGNCRKGFKTCQADGAWSVCQGAVAPAAQDSCDVAGDDADCNGNPNEGCVCQEGETRPCGTDTGACQTGTQTCTNQTWGLCEGQIAPLDRDSCATTGDDSNCNDLPNEGCACTEDNPSACNDNILCTTDTCQDGVCVNTSASGYCLIQGTCVAHNAPDPNNPCRYCDAGIKQDGWTNYSATNGCDDGVWCNGTDSCDGYGTCVHQFPDGNRCGSGPCALPGGCDEAQDRCYRAADYVCNTTTERNCPSSNCGGTVMIRQVKQYCSGSSAACDGSPQTGGWSVEKTCAGDEVCSSATGTCAKKLGCGTSWCDPSSGLCWTTEDAANAMQWADAKNYCASFELGGRTDWRLPSIDEWVTIVRGCDGISGEVEDWDVHSSCQWLGEPENPPLVNCTQCPYEEGWGNNGAYWPSEMGTAGNSTYHSSTEYPPYPVSFGPASVGVVYFYPDASFGVRCVLTE